MVGKDAVALQHMKIKFDEEAEISNRRRPCLFVETGAAYHETIPLQDFVNTPPDIAFFLADDIDTTLKPALGDKPKNTFQLREKTLCYHYGYVNKTRPTHILVSNEKVTDNNYGNYFERTCKDDNVYPAPGSSGAPVLDVSNKLLGLHAVVSERNDGFDDAYRNCFAVRYPKMELTLFDGLKKLIDEHDKDFDNENKKNTRETMHKLLSKFLSTSSSNPNIRTTYSSTPSIISAYLILPIDDKRYYLISTKSKDETASFKDFEANLNDWRNQFRGDMEFKRIRYVVNPNNDHKHNLSSALTLPSGSISLVLPHSDSDKYYKINSGVQVECVTFKQNIENNMQINSSNNSNDDDKNNNNNKINNK